MQIWVDADACPSEVKQLLFRAAKRTATKVTLVANQPIRTPRSEYIRSLLVGADLNAADRRIVELVEPGDLVITADIPLAADVVASGAQALNPRGELYTDANVGERVAVRNLLDELRGGGMVTGGPAHYGDKRPAGLCESTRSLVDSREEMSLTQPVDRATAATRLASRCKFTGLVLHGGCGLGQSTQNADKLGNAKCRKSLHITKPVMLSWHSTWELEFAASPSSPIGTTVPPDMQISRLNGRLTDSVNASCSRGRRRWHWPVPWQEMIFSGEPYHPGFVAEWAADWQMAWEATKPLLTQQRKRLVYLEQTTVRLHQLLNRDEHWAALAAIVDNLLAHETLDGQEVEDIVRQWI